jgi:hypothetical protein
MPSLQKVGGPLLSSSQPHLGLGIGRPLNLMEEDLIDQTMTVVEVESGKGVNKEARRQCNLGRESIE